jgi:isopentenyl-diphosphate delta-isomerase
VSFSPTALRNGGDDVVVLVDQRGTAVGVAPKLEAHQTGRLHRAVSVVLFDESGRLLLQRRANTKYHSGGLWSNTCCGHPRPGESVLDAAGRRLNDELGITGCELTEVSRFVYLAHVANDMVEHELDHVLIGRWTGETAPDPAEVSETRWVDRDTMFAELAGAPGLFTAWMRDVVDRACYHDRWATQ